MTKTTKTPKERIQQSGESFKEAGKERIQQSGESFKEAGKSLKETTIAGAKSIRNIMKGTYQAIDAGDKKIGEGIEKKMKEKGKDTSGKIKNFFRNNIIKILLGAGLITHGGVEITQHVKDQHKENTEIAEGTYLDKFGNDDKVFIIDVSEYNELNESKFKEWNEKRWESSKDDVRGVSGIYIRVQKEGGADEDFQTFYEGIKRYNETAEQGQHIAIGGYIFFNKAKSAITDEGIKKQVDDAISRLEIINDDTDGIVDLVPMLDFEFTNNPGASSERGKNCKEAVLKRLQLFEQKTGIVPGIYTGGSIYHDYFLNDPRFSKYPVRIATYNGKRVDQSPDGHSVLIGPIGKPVEYQPELVQFTEEITGSGFGTEGRGKGFLDGSTTTKDKFQELIIRNNDAPTDLE